MYGLHHTYLKAHMKSSKLIQLVLSGSAGKTLGATIDP